MSSSPRSRQTRSWSVEHHLSTWSSSRVAASLRQCKSPPGWGNDHLLQLGVLVRRSRVGPLRSAANIRCASAVLHCSCTHCAFVLRQALAWQPVQVIRRAQLLQCRSEKPAALFCLLMSPDQSMIFRSRAPMRGIPRAFKSEQINLVN